jgi:hypothetical protein
VQNDPPARPEDSRRHASGPEGLDDLDLRFGVPVDLSHRWPQAPTGGEYVAEPGEPAWWLVAPDEQVVARPQRAGGGLLRRQSPQRL